MRGNKKITTYDPGAQVTGGCLSLHRNENMFVGSSCTIEVAREVISHDDIATYPEPECATLRRDLADLYDVDPASIFVGNGSDEVLADLLGILRARYECLHLLDVCFRVYPMLADRYNYRVATLNGNTFQTGDIKTEGFRGLAVVDSPNSITSNRVEMQTLLRLASDPTSFLIWDNAYGEFAEDVIPRSLPKNVVVVRSFSKYYALAGLRIGYCIANPAIVEQLLVIKDAFNVNGFAQVMAREALQRQAVYRQVSNEIYKCRAELVETLHRFGFHVHPAFGNFVLATHPTYSAEQLEAHLRRHGIVVRRFTGGKTDNYIRITVAPPPIIARLVNALEIILKQNTQISIEMETM